MERRITLRKNDKWVNKFTVRSCGKFRMRERISDKKKDIRVHKLRNGMEKENMVMEVNKK
jgi:hypothetical protein